MWEIFLLIFIGLTGWFCLSSLNDFNNANIHPDHRKTPRRKRKIIHDATIDYLQIKNLIEVRLSGHLSDSQMLKLPTKTGSILILALVERQLVNVSISLNLTWASYSVAANSIKKNRLATELFSIIEALYEEFDRDSKFEMMPLFFSPAMDSDESIYLFRTECRNATSLIFEKFLDRDGLSVETLKREFLLAHKYHYLLPLNDKIWI